MDEADLFFEALTGRSAEPASSTSVSRPGIRCNSDDQYYDEYDDEYESRDQLQFEDAAQFTEAVSIDTAAAIPPFTNSEKANILTPLLTATARAAALRWYNNNHPTRSGVSKAELRSALANYVDFTALARTMSSSSKTVSPSSDDALIEAIHQFQKKCFVDARQVDAKAGESTLDSLGLIARSGLRNVNSPNRKRKAFLRTKASKINTLSSGEFTHSTWFNHMVNASFLGRRFTNGIHLHLLRALRSAEKHLLTLPLYAGKTPVQIGAALGINEIHKGARPTSNSRSMHTLGLATDINYRTSPWITQPYQKKTITLADGSKKKKNVARKGTREFIAVMGRATKLISGWTTRLDSAYLHGLGSGGRSTASVYDELKRRSDDLVQYLALARNREALESALAARRAAGDTGYTDVAAWSRRISKDLRLLKRSLGSGGNFGSLRDPRKGFMGLHRDLVIALRDVACMAWGAIDFGPTYCGDVMHFDVRRRGLGQALNEAGYRTAVPCPASTPAVTTPTTPRSAAGVPSRVTDRPQGEADLFFEEFTSQSVMGSDVSRQIERDIYPEVVARHGQHIGKGTFQHGPLNHTNPRRRNRGKNVAARWNVDANTLAGTTIDIVVYLHGYGTPASNFLVKKASAAGLDMVDSSGAVTVRSSGPTLALVPLGLHMPTSRRPDRWVFSNLTTKKSFNGLVNKGLQWLATDVLGLAAGTTLKAGRLTLIAHSGGGSAMKNLLNNGLNPDELICHDSVYSTTQAQSIIKWSTRKIARPGASTGALRVFYSGGTLAGSRLIKRKVDKALRAQTTNCLTLSKRYRVERTRVGHSNIPKAYTSQLLNDITATVPRTTGGRAPCTTATNPGRTEALAAASMQEISLGEHQNLIEMTPTQIVDRIRDMALRAARARHTFLTESEVRTAINSRSPGDPVDLLMSQSVTSVQAFGAIPLIGPIIESGALFFRVVQLLVLLERQKFKCPQTGVLSLDMSVVDAMRNTWTATSEGQTVDGLCSNVVTPCPTTHQTLHGAGQAAHFTRLSQPGIRVVELAGLWGKNLIGVTPQSHRARVAVKALDRGAPAATLSFVAVRNNNTRHVHFGKETPRRVEAYIGNDIWKNLAIEAAPGIDYQVFKRRYWEASFHRQWGKEATIVWLKGLAQFYRDRTGGVLGIGDISHIVGEDMTDHASHERGVDVDLYGLDATPAGTVFPTSFWATVVSGAISFKPLGMPAAGSASPVYTVPGAGVAALAGADAARVQHLYVTILAYCAATQGLLSAVIWHGAHRLRTDAVTQAQAAWDATVAAGLGSTSQPGWQSNWGPGPANRAAISAPIAKFIGNGSSNYGASAAWPPHRDHVHVRLN